jgi:hypothetical protein
MRRDSIFYQLFRQAPTLLFELLPQPPDNAAGYVFEAILRGEATPTKLRKRHLGSMECFCRLLDLG